MIMVMLIMFLFWFNPDTLNKFFINLMYLYFFSLGLNVLRCELSSFHESVMVHQIPLTIPANITNRPNKSRQIVTPSTAKWSHVQIVLFAIDCSLMTRKLTFSYPLALFKDIAPGTGWDQPTIHAKYNQQLDLNGSNSTIFVNISGGLSLPFSKS